MGVIAVDGFAKSEDFREGNKMGPLGNPSSEDRSPPFESVAPGAEPHLATGDDPTGVPIGEQAVLLYS